MSFFLNSKSRNAALLFVLAAVFGSFSSIVAAENAIEVATKIASAATNSANPQPGHNFIIADLNLELIWVKPGTFTLGSASHEPHRNKAEGPQTQVKITRGFWLGKTEVTQAQYEKITGENPSAFKNVGTNAPVERVSWVHAMNFCKKLTDRERAAGRLPAGYAYTLPTEAQWEYAYRAGTTSEYPEDPEAMAWHEGNSGETSHPVAQRRPNPWGFHDMAGNILEWTYDWYGPYPGGTVTDPFGPRRGYYRTARGGSWRKELRVTRSAGRSGGSETREDYTIGFRLALSPIPSTTR